MWRWPAEENVSTSALELNTRWLELYLNFRKINTLFFSFCNIWNVTIFIYLYIYKYSHVCPPPTIHPVNGYTAGWCWSQLTEALKVAPWTPWTGCQLETLNFSFFLNLHIFGLLKEDRKLWEHTHLHFLSRLAVRHGGVMVGVIVKRVFFFFLTLFFSLHNMNICVFACAKN